MAVPVLQSVAGSEATGTTFTVTKPTVNVGDIVGVAVLLESSSPTLTPHSDFNSGYGVQVYNASNVDYGYALFLREIQSGDPASWDFSLSSSTTAHWVVFRVTGAAGITDVLNAYGLDAGKPASHTSSPSVTTDEDDCLLVGFFGTDVSGSVSWSTDGGETEEYDAVNSSFLGLGLYSAPATTAGSYTVNGTHDYGSDQDQQGILIALKRSAGVVYVGSTKGTQSASSTTAAIDFTGFSVGDYALVEITRQSVAAPSGVPSGWSAVDALGTSGVKTWIYGKHLEAGDIGSVTWTWAGAAQTQITTSVYAHVDTSTPIDTQNSVESDSSSSTLALSSITSSETFLVIMASFYSTTSKSYDAVSGYIERLDEGSTAPDEFHMHGDTNGQWGGGTSNPSVTLSAAAAYHRGFHIALKAASTGGPAAQDVTLTGIPSTLAFGTLTVEAVTGPGAQEITLTGIASTLVFGGLTLGVGGVQMELVGIPSSLVFGDLAVRPADEEIVLVGIPSTLAFGDLQVYHQGDIHLDFRNAGIASTLVFGDLLVRRQEENHYSHPGKPTPHFCPRCRLKQLDRYILRCPRCGLQLGRKRG